MLKLSHLAAATLASLGIGCTPAEAPKSLPISEKVYSVTPPGITVKGGVLSGALTELKIVERVEESSGRVDQAARLTGKLVLTNVSKDLSVRLVSGRLLYIDAQGRPIELEDRRAEPTLRVSSSYGSQERLDPGQEASQSVEAEFPAEALKAKRLREIRLELNYIPSTYRQESMNFGVSVGG